MSADRPIGLFGGAFDPFHNGHLQILLKAMEFKSFEKILLIPTFHAAHREASLLSYEWRFQALEQLAASLENSPEASSPKIEVSDIESKLPAPSYTYRTIETFREIYGPEKEFFFFIGADSLNSLSSWHEWQYLVQECRFLVFPRQGSSLTIDPKICDQSQIHVMELPEIPISSTLIRQKLQQKQSIHGLVPESIREALLKFKLTFNEQS